MNNTIDALKALYVALGGTEADVDNIVIIPDMINAIADVEDGGGSSGASLPVVTADDNGSVLTVVEGSWDKAQPSGGSAGYTKFYLPVFASKPTYGVPIPIYKDSTFTDLTNAEMTAAWEAGAVFLGDESWTCLAMGWNKSINVGYGIGIYDQGEIVPFSFAPSANA